MTPYYYLKTQAREGLLTFVKPVVSYRILRLMALFFFSFGLGLLSWLVWPFLEWRVIYVPRFGGSEIIRPLPQAQAETTGGGNNLIYARNWFPQAPPQRFLPSSVKEYRLSIPKLKINQAQVIVGGEDLSQSLIHYGGTALPGENGTAVVFGHSVLPQFFNPQNYKAIFSTLHTLEEGDRILVTVDGLEYTYRIFGFEIVDPSETSFLEQKKEDAYLYLVTCTPPGTYWKRLIVKTKLEAL